MSYKKLSDDVNKVKIYSPIGKMDQNGNLISFADACRAANGNSPLYGTVITNVNINGGVDNSNLANDSWNQWSSQPFNRKSSPGNAVSIVASTIQTGGVFGEAYIPKAISNAIKPTYSFEYKNVLAAKAAQNAERFEDAIKLGDYGAKGAVVFDVGYSAYSDIINPEVPAGKVATNMVVNTTFDSTGLLAATAIGGMGGPLGAGIGWGFGLLYITVTQAWTPGGKSLQDRAKDSVYDEVKKAAASQPIYQTKIDQEGNYPEWMLHMK